MKNLKEVNLPKNTELILNFLYARLVNVHNENKDYDYMIHFKTIIKQIEKLNGKKIHTELKDRCCRCNESKKSVISRIDPYEEYMHDKIVNRLFCDECFYLY